MQNTLLRSSLHVLHSRVLNLRAGSSRLNSAHALPTWVRLSVHAALAFTRVLCLPVCCASVCVCLYVLQQALKGEAAGVAITISAAV